MYLEELGDIRQLPLGLALMVLTTVEEQAPEEARYLLERARAVSSEESVQVPAASRTIIEMVTMIMVYKFENLSRVEVEAMLGLSLQETRVYQEARAEGREEGRRQEAGSLVLRQLTRRLQQESEQMRSQVELLSLPQLEALAEALLDFSNITDLEAWLAQQKPSKA